jgi:biopolymer transport protein ExbD
MPMTAHAADPHPIAAINITPLIDVLLVLLVMMIITLPATTHEIPVNLPQPGPDQQLPQKLHRLDIAPSGALTLDGAAVAEAALGKRLSAITADRQATLTLNPDATVRYEVFDRVLAVIKRAGVTRLGFVGNERFADFDKP